MSIAYFKIYSHTKQSKQAILKIGTTSTETQKQILSSLAMNLALDIVVSAICWMPLTILNLIMIGGMEILDDIVISVIMMTFPFKSVINPTRYTFKSDLFKSELKKLLRK